MHQYVPRLIAEPSSLRRLRLDQGHPSLGALGLAVGTIAEFGIGYCPAGRFKGSICIPLHSADGELIGHMGLQSTDAKPSRNKATRNVVPKRKMMSGFFNLHRIPRETHHIVVTDDLLFTIHEYTLGVPTVGIVGSICRTQVALLASRGVRLVTLLVEGNDDDPRERSFLISEFASHLYVNAPELPVGACLQQISDAAKADLLRDFLADLYSTG